MDETVRKSTQNLITGNIFIVTTIAVRDNVMACDSEVGISTDGGGARSYYNSIKIYKIEGEFIGGSGESAGVLLWYDWYMNGCKGKRLSKRMWEFDFDIIILHSDGRIQASDASGTFEDINEDFYAIGSGTKCALAAMHCGRSAEEAVEISKLIDSHTGGKVQVFSHE